MNVPFECDELHGSTYYWNSFFRHAEKTELNRVSFFDNYTAAFVKAVIWFCSLDGLPEAETHVEEVSGLNTEALWRDLLQEQVRCNPQLFSESSRKNLLETALAYKSGDTLEGLDEFFEERKECRKTFKSCLHWIFWQTYVDHRAFSIASMSNLRNAVQDLSDFLKTADLSRYCGKMPDDVSERLNKSACCSVEDYMYEFYDPAFPDGDNWATWASFDSYEFWMSLLICSQSWMNSAEDRQTLLKTATLCLRACQKRPYVDNWREYMLDRIVGLTYQLALIEINRQRSECGLSIWSRESRRNSK